METIFYDLEPISSQWKIAFTADHDKKTGGVFKPLSERKMINIEGSIPMATYNFIQDKNEWKYMSPFDYDILNWTDDITLGSRNFSGGITSIVISSKLKKIIEKFDLPKHKFYPVRLDNIYNKESKIWYLLYMPEHRLNYINWNACEFKLKPSYLDKGKIDVEYIGPGVANNFDDFKELRNKYREDKIKKFLEFYKVAYKVNYDVMWGNPNILTISSKLKEAIVSEDIKVNISEHKELIILPN